MSLFNSRLQRKSHFSSISVSKFVNFLIPNKVHNRRSAMDAARAQSSIGFWRYFIADPQD